MAVPSCLILGMNARAYYKYEAHPELRSTTKERTSLRESCYNTMQSFKVTCEKSAEADKKVSGGLKVSVRLLLSQPAADFVSGGLIVSR